MRGTGDATNHGAMGPLEASGQDQQLRESVAYQVHTSLAPLILMMF